MAADASILRSAFLVRTMDPARKVYWERPPQNS